MKDFLRYQRTIFGVILLLVLATAVVLFLVFDEPRYAFGMILGGAAGIIKLRLRVISLLQMASGDQAAAKSQVRAGIAGYALMAAALAAAIFRPNTFYVWTAFAGLLLPNLVLIVDGMLRPQLFAQAAGESTDEA